MTKNTARLAEIRAELHRMNEAFQKHLASIRQLSLSQWIKLANELNVELNDREHAAKKLALRELAA